MDNILKTDITKNIYKPLTLLEFKNHLLQEKSKQVNIFDNNKIDSFQVTLDGTEDDSILMSDINSIMAPSSIMFIAGTEPSQMAYMPQVKNQYSRILADEGTTTTDPPPSPEGTEFSIYYQNEYLYITPDIFTGIMTSLFVFFTIYIGLSCLGGIQTNDTYATRACSVGKTKD
jgi:hypothetical protein